MRQTELGEESKDWLTWQQYDVNRSRLPQTFAYLMDHGPADADPG